MGRKQGTRFAAARPVGAGGQDPVLLAAPGRHIFVAWASNTSGPLSIREWTGGSRLKRLASPADRASAQAPQLAIAGHDLVVAWAMNVDDPNLSAGNLPNGALSVASRPLSSNRFHPSQVIATSSRDLSLAGAPDGSAVLAFGNVITSPDASQSEVATVANRGPSGRFGAAIALESNAPVVDIGPVAAINANGTATVEWYTGTSGQTTVQAATIQPGGTPSAAVTLGVGGSPLAIAATGTTTILTWAGPTAYQAQTGVRL